MKSATAVSAITVMGMGLAAVPAQASPGKAAAKGHHFACSRVGSSDSAYCHTSTVRVGPGKRLRVAVRGSKGHLVRFHAVTSKGNWAGRWSHYRKYGQRPTTVWKNHSRHTVKIHLRAQAKIHFHTVSVYGTEYVHR